MKIKFLYYYYVSDKTTFINEIINYNKTNQYNIDEILDIYNENKNNKYFTDIYYLIVDEHNIKATKYLIELTQSDNKFKGWIQTNSNIYNYINQYFINSGKMNNALLKIKNLHK
jgi:hypothetical protein